MPPDSFHTNSMPPRPEEAGGSGWQQGGPFLYTTSIPPRPEEAGGSGWQQGGSGWQQGGPFLYTTSIPPQHEEVGGSGWQYQMMAAPGSFMLISKITRSCTSTLRHLNVFCCVDNYRSTLIH